MINASLSSLKGFPTLPKLRRLELSDNRFTNGLEYLEGCQNLHHLSLCGNRFKDFESIEPLKKLASLQNLDLFNCGITEVPSYREKVFEMLPSLKYLDGYDRANKESEDAEEDDDEEEDDVEDEVDFDEDDGEEVADGQLRDLLENLDVSFVFLHFINFLILIRLFLPFCFCFDIFRRKRKTPATTHLTMKRMILTRKISMKETTTTMMMEGHQSRALREKPKILLRLRILLLLLVMMTKTKMRTRRNEFDHFPFFL